jgi:hypothetical protein
MGGQQSFGLPPNGQQYPPSGGYPQPYPPSGQYSGDYTQAPVHNYEMYGQQQPSWQGQGRPPRSFVAGKSSAIAIVAPKPGDGKSKAIKIMNPKTMKEVVGTKIEKKEGEGEKSEDAPVASVTKEEVVEKKEEKKEEAKQTPTPQPTPAPKIVLRNPSSNKIIEVKKPVSNDAKSADFEAEKLRRMNDFKNESAKLDKRTLKGSTNGKSMEELRLDGAGEEAKVAVPEVKKEVPAVKKEDPVVKKEEVVVKKEEVDVKKEEPVVKKVEAKVAAPAVELKEDKDLVVPSIEVRRSASPDRLKPSPIETFKPITPSTTIISSKDITYPEGIVNPDIDTAVRPAKYAREFLLAMRELATNKPDGFISVQDLINDSTSNTNSPRPEKRASMDRGGPQSARGMQRQSSSGGSRYAIYQIDVY